MTLYTGGSDGFVSSTITPIASGWSEPSSRAGLSPAVDQHLSTAHVLWGYYVNRPQVSVVTYFRISLVNGFAPAALPATGGDGGPTRMTKFHEDRGNVGGVKRGYISPRFVATGLPLRALILISGIIDTL